MIIYRHTVQLLFYLTGVWRGYVKISFAFNYVKKRSGSATVLNK